MFYYVIFIILCFCFSVLSPSRCNRNSVHSLPLHPRASILCFCILPSSCLHYLCRLVSSLFVFPCLFDGVCFLVLRVFSALCLGNIVLVCFLVLHVFCVLCLGSRKWFSVWRKLFLRTKIVCGRCIWSRGLPTDVGCDGKTVHLTGCFSRNFLGTMKWRFSSLRTWDSSRVRCSVTSAKEIWRGKQTPIVQTDLGGDVQRVLLRTGVVGPRPLGTAVVPAE